jgi:hypothetical protein
MEEEEVCVCVCVVFLLLHAESLDVLSVYTGLCFRPQHVLQVHV